MAYVLCPVPHLITLTSSQWFLDRSTISLKTRARGAFLVLMVTAGGWWTWSTILTARFSHTQPTFDWSTPGFSSAFALFLLLVLSFQLHYLYLYFVVGHLACTPEDVVRLAALLRGTESAAQALSYGLSSVRVFALYGGSALNFGLWGAALVPAWLVVRDIGGRLGDRREERERGVQEEQGLDAALPSESERPSNEKSRVAV